MFRPGWCYNTMENPRSDVAGRLDHHYCVDRSKVVIREEILKRVQAIKHKKNCEQWC